MQNKIFLTLIILCAFALLFSDVTRLDPDEYIVKIGDSFLIRALDYGFIPDATFVTPTGDLSLFPLADTVMIAGSTLTEAYEKINQKIKSKVSQEFLGDRFVVQLHDIAPTRYHIFGAVVGPGQYMSEIGVPTLHMAIREAGGFILTGSRKIKIVRRGKILEFNLNNFFAYNDITQNPYIMQDDIILVNRSDNYVKVFTNTEEENFIETIELDSQAKTIDDIVMRTYIKYPKSNYDDFTVERDGKYMIVDGDFELQPFDNVFVHSEELYVYVTGHVAIPARYKYNGAQNIHYYVSQSGGVREDGNRDRIYIIRKGQRLRYKGQEIEPGDTIYVTQLYRRAILAYLTPMATVVSLITSTIVLYRMQQQ